MLNASYTFRFRLTLLAVCFTCFTCSRCDFVSKSVYNVANLAYTSSCDDSLRLQAEGFWNDAGVSSHTARSVHAHERDKLKATHVSHGTRDIGTLVLLTYGNDLPTNAKTLFYCSCTEEL